MSHVCPPALAHARSHIAAARVQSVLQLLSLAFAAVSTPLECSVARMTTSFASHRPSVAGRRDWNLYVTVAACQEDLRWLRCDMHPNLRRIHVIHKPKRK